ncbi:hypothetical protein K1T71_014028 [Dendrolimus kikuchii]|uniref:Uncharacterized protein n=1 Tax=Dendrolimus kikuchii TaxID=765133 RepID=A0ACC1CES8_9NEOP|nr:hypothetical protein K1T71_014028 [Dendrolimus kikuchii]
MKSTQMFAVLVLACVCVQLCAASPAPAGVSEAEGGAAGKQPAAAVFTREDGKSSYASSLSSAAEGVVLGAAQSIRSG